MLLANNARKTFSGRKGITLIPLFNSDVKLEGVCKYHSREQCVEAGENSSGSRDRTVLLEDEELARYRETIDFMPTSEGSKQPIILELIIEIKAACCRRPLLLVSENLPDFHSL